MMAESTPAAQWASYLFPQPETASTCTEQAGTILIVDDDEAMVEVLVYRLNRQGFQTLTASRGQSGLMLARAHRPDVILLDLRLPDTDGFSVCQELVDSPETCDIPVIIISGMEGPDIVRRARMAGCQYFLRKPYDPNALLVLIRHAMHAHEF